MPEKSEPHLWLHDIAACLGLLTRLPVKVQSELAMTRSAAATWAYPVVGLLLGVIGILVFSFGTWVGFGSLTSTVLVFGTLIVLTGAMHEDGLADSADGLWGGWTIARRLEIMKDSHIGVYGVCAVVICVLLKISIVASLFGVPSVGLALIGSAALSRAAMVALMYALAPARGGGLGKSVGRPPLRSAWIAFGLASGFAIFAGALIGLITVACAMILATGIAAFGCARIAKAKVNGFTGDILGATQQVCEVAALLTFSALVY